MIVTVRLLQALLIPYTAWLVVFGRFAWWMPLPYLGVAALLTWGVVDLRSGIFVRALIRRPAASGLVALTFDDGPEPSRSLALAEVVERHGGRATFFLIGQKVDRHPATARDLAGRGHQLAWHGYSHDWFGTLRPPSRIRAELDACVRSFEAAGLNQPHLFRPPIGLINPLLAHELERRGLTTVGWAVRSLDTRLDDEQVLARVLAQVQGGDIVLLHDGAQGPNTRRPGLSPEGLDRLLTALAARGLRCCTIDGLLAAGRPASTSTPMVE